MTKIIEEPFDQKSVAIDFDAVVSHYYGWQGKGVFGVPIKGARESLDLLRKAGRRVIIHTSRVETWLIAEYMKKHSIPYHFINHNPDNVYYHLSPLKVAADVYVDDRALRFDGNWEKTFTEIINFVPWWKKGETETPT